MYAMYVNTVCNVCNVCSVCKKIGFSRFCSCSVFLSATVLQAFERFGCFVAFSFVCRCFIYFLPVLRQTGMQNTPKTMLQHVFMIPSQIRNSVSKKYRACNSMRPSRKRSWERVRKRPWESEVPPFFSILYLSSPVLFATQQRAPNHSKPGTVSHLSCRLCGLYQHPFFLAHFFPSIFSS